MSANGFLRRCALAAVLAAAGCSSIDKLVAPTLSGTPATSSLVVVVCEVTMLGVFDLRTNQKVEFALLTGTGGRGRFVGQPISNLIIFSDVPPGEYSLTGVRAIWMTGNNTSQTNSYPVPEGEASRFVVRTRLGEPAFLGVVAIQEVRKLNERGVKFTLTPSKEAEIQALEKFAELYGEHPWAAAARKRVSELKP